MPHYSSIAITIASPIFFNASRFLSVGGSATLIRRQLRYFPEAENSDPAAAWIFSRHSCLLTHTISTVSGSSTHSRKLPCGRVTHISAGKYCRTQQV